MGRPWCCRGNRNSLRREARAVIPGDPAEELEQAGTTARVDCGNVSDEPAQMSAEVGDTGVRPAGRRRTQLLRIALSRSYSGTPDVRPHVHDDTRQMLAHALPHESRLARIDLEPFFQRDPADQDLKPGADRSSISPPEKARSSA